MISITSVCVGRIRVDIISCCVVWVLGGGTPDQLPHIYYHLLSSGSLHYCSSPLLLVNFSQNAWQISVVRAAATPRISINLHESWPRLGFQWVSSQNSMIELKLNSASPLRHSLWVLERLSTAGCSVLCSTGLYFLSDIKRILSVY